MNRRLLVTGGAGFIGANFVHHWVHHHPGDRVVVLDALTYAGNRSSLEEVAKHPSFRFVHGDILDGALVEELLHRDAIDTLVHFAAESHVDRSILSPAEFLRTNVEGTHSLLRAARSAWLESPGRPRQHRFHHVSTDEVYGSLGPEEPGFHEESPYAPTSPYAASKAASDHLVRSFHLTFGLDVTLSHSSNNYGPFHFPEKLIPLMLLNVLQGRELPLYGDGLQVRDWLYVADHVRGLEQVLEHGHSGESYNLGGGQERTNLEVVHALCAFTDELFALDEELRERIFGNDACLRERFPDCPAARGEPCAQLIRMVKDRPGHDRRYAIDDRKAQRELGFTPVESFDSGLRRTLVWYLDHERWWREIQTGDYQAWIQRQYGSGPPREGGDSATRAHRA